MEKKMMIPCPTMAVIDGDIIAYKVAFRAEVDDPAFIPQMVEEYLESWLPDEAEDFRIALSCSRKDNYRRNIWPLYKMNRDTQDTPEYLKEIKDYIQDIYPIDYVDRLEADDLLGIAASSGTGIAVTIDKDLRGVSGWHYNPDKEEKSVYISPEEAELFFLVQWMTGDSTDNIPGLWRIGPKRARSLMKKWEGEDIYQNIIDMYHEEKYIPKKTCDLEGDDLAFAMARCVKILENGDYDSSTDKINLWVPKVGV